MTSEISVMNKDAVALAADSTVTISGKKAYHTINKLFALSQYHPVGIMIYGSGEIGGIPWETLIKLYRTEIGAKKFGSLADYRKGFVKFVETKTSYFDKADEKETFLEYADDYLDILIDEIDSFVEDKIKEKIPITSRSIAARLRAIIRKHHGLWTQKPRLGIFSKANSIYARKSYKDDVFEIIEEKSEKHSISKQSKDLIYETCESIFFSKCTNISGVVFAGFGEDELFPSLEECQIECIFNKKIKVIYKNFRIENNPEKSSFLAPFAQRDTVTMLMEGMSNDVLHAVFDGLSRGLDSHSQEIAKNLEKKGIDPLLIKNAIDDAGTKKEEIYSRFSASIKKKKYECHISPFLEAVKYLPKNEMAEVAESLVSITSFRQKISLEQETVGGAIDVAVISKSDGFVWIKRKHYFDQKLNPMFMSRYYPNPKEGSQT